MVRKTKNDQRSETRVTPFFYAEEGEERCLLTVVERYAKQIHGSLTRKEGCTKGRFPARLCPHCAPLFPRILTSTIKWLPIVPSELPKRLKAVFRYLEERGEAQPDLWRKISCSSWRRGGNTIACAEGIRLDVRKKHGRWRAESTVGEYEGAAPGDERQISVALQARVSRVAEQKQKNHPK